MVMDIPLKRSFLPVGGPLSQSGGHVAVFSRLFRTCSDTAWEFDTRSYNKSNQVGSGQTRGLLKTISNGVIVGCSARSTTVYLHSAR